MPLMSKFKYSGSCFLFCFCFPCLYNLRVKNTEVNYEVNCFMVIVELADCFLTLDIFKPTVDTLDSVLSTVVDGFVLLAYCMYL